MAPTRANRTALEQLRRDERAAVLRRRRAAGLGNARARQAPTVGLALSGGGVRSATFGLGLIRGLAAQDLLRRIDYLSTVSGGGYVGAMLGRLVCGVGLTEAQRLLAAGGSPVLDWLRRNGRYLTPAGSRDLGILAVSFLRAFLAVHVEALFTLIPLALLVTLPHLLQDSLGPLDATRWQGWASPWFALALLWSAALLPALLVAYWAAPETARTPAAGRRVYLGDAGLLVALIGVALLGTQRPGTGALVLAWRQAELAAPLLVLALWSAAAGHAYAMLRLALAREPRALAVARLRNRLTYGLRGALLCAAALAGMGALDGASWQLLLALSATPDPAWVWGGVGLGGALVVALRALALPLQQLAARAMERTARAVVGPLLLGLAGHLAALVLALAWLVATQWWVFAEAPLPALRAFPAWMRWGMLGLAALVWWLTTSRLAQAANASSLAGFYQARLVRAYLSVGNPRRGLWTPFTPADARLRSVTEVAGGDDVPLAAHRPEMRGGPLHLINTCLNQTRDDASGLFNADRKGQLVVASARALEVGPHDVVRWPADAAGTADGDTPGSLGRWVAISGAAAAPGAGAYTTRGWALVMFMLGIRLGHWIESPLPERPLAAAAAWLWRRAPKPMMLWSEAGATFFGAARPWWYLSDGGHFDNTGVYALIKRECDFIILSDAGADGDYQFADIENLVRKARIDLDAEIEFYPRQEADRLFSLAGSGICVLSPEDLADNAARRGVLLARIRYRRSGGGQNERDGTLLIVKPSVHAALDLDLLAYAQRRPGFPHESTGDQFFDEAQWESYQRLGEDVGLALYDRWLAQLPGWDRPQTQKLASPARLRRPAAAPPAQAEAVGPRWRRGARAAAIGTSVGVGVTGTLLLSLWQVQDQFKRDEERRQTEVRELLADAAREMGALGATACAPVGAQMLAHVEQLRALDGSGAVTPAEQNTVTRLLGRARAHCGATTDAGAACAPALQAQRDELCALALKPRGDSGALSYWHPAPRPPDSLSGWAQAWALLRGAAPPAGIAAAPPASEPAPAGMTAAPAPSPAATPAAPAPTTQVESLDAAQAAALKAACPPGTRLYLQIYDESARPRAEALRQRLNGAGQGVLAVTPIENVTRTAAVRQARRPVPWQQPTFVVHDSAVQPCAHALADAVRPHWPQADGTGVWVTSLPDRLKGQPRTMELWLPTPPQDQPAAR
ncbi:hypothetical protein [Ottowia sp.]|jgi:predicted acylesterase/phospholipase RssA|uniref:hypothetical protein n=1 Tax=Ottowia sp. TaxID=1898956 RepID=UPI0025EF647B|nr:hypothetical protein [Ottowia sp.]MBK6613511.1 hypothetical protein [Ottowia sp.]MBK6747384.1 hypothetical protein [Ottowia sp.]